MNFQAGCGDQYASAGGENAQVCSGRLSVPVVLVLESCGIFLKWSEDEAVKRVCLWCSGTWSQVRAPLLVKGWLLNFHESMNRKL